MWFNNALIYRFEIESIDELRTALTENALKPCPPHARFIYGWLPAVEDQLVFETSQCAMICMGKEERLLPKGVINQHLKERINSLETQRGYAVKRNEKAQMAEELEFELLPKAFCLQKRTQAIIDTVSKRLIINTASLSQANQLLSLLRKSLPGVFIEAMDPSENLALRFTNWITDHTTLPPAFTLASDCLLFSLDNEKKRFNCKGYELPADEILTLLSQGLAAAEVSLIWQDRIQFTITHELILKKLKCLDYLVDEFAEANSLESPEEQNEASLILLSGELRRLWDDLGL